MPRSAAWLCKGQRATKSGRRLRPRHQRSLKSQVRAAAYERSGRDRSSRLTLSGNSDEYTIAMSCQKHRSVALGGALIQCYNSIYSLSLFSLGTQYGCHRRQHMQKIKLEGEPADDEEDEWWQRYAHMDHERTSKVTFLRQDIICFRSGSRSRLEIDDDLQRVDQLSKV